ncbi:MAG: BON domain-containing protein [Candidatus Binataceae bacterium]|nr:BON domain-containing protein [Candidatus Binataceae bacterium]
MASNKRLLIGVSAIAATFAFSPFSFAQISSNPAAAPAMNSTAPATNSSSMAANANENGSGMMSKRELRRKVKLALRHDAETKHCDIHVHAMNDGTVRLTGHVASADLAQHAEQVAQQVNGVKNVENHIRSRGSATSETKGGAAGMNSDSSGSEPAPSTP